MFRNIRYKLRHAFRMTVTQCVSKHTVMKTNLEPMPKRRCDSVNVAARERQRKCDRVNAAAAVLRESQ